MKGEDLGHIREVTEQLKIASHGVAEMLYKQQGASTEQVHSSNDQPDSEIVDGEFAEVSER